MKKYILEFLRNGLHVCAFGPIILAIIYFILQKCGVIDVISVNKMAIEILTVTLLAFIAGGISIVYHIEKLPMILAILIHGLILYLDYVIIYLVNDWIASEPGPFLCFTLCFVVGFALIWIIIYLVTKRNADKLNRQLEKMQKVEE